MANTDVNSERRTRLRNMQALLVLFREFGDLRWYLPLLILAGLLATFFEGLGLYLLVPLFDTLLSSQGQGTASSSFIPDPLQGLINVFPEESRLTALIVCVLVLIILKNVMRYIDDVAWTWYDAAINKRVQSKLFARLMANDPRDRHLRSGKALNTFENQSWRAVDTLLGLCSAFGEFLAVAFFIGLLLLLSWQMTLAVFFGSLVLFGIVNVMSRRIETLGHEVVETEERVSSKLWDVLTGLKTIRITGNEKHESQEFDRKIDDTVMTGFRQEKLASAVEPIIESLAALMIAALCIISLGRDLSTLPVLVTFIVVLRRLVPRIQGLIGVQVSLAAEIASVHNILPYLEVPETAKPAGPSVPFNGLDGDIVVDRVSYRHEPDSALALDDVSFRIPRGKITGLAGPSGAGKSTIVDLLCRIATPEAGRFTINGRDIATYDPDDWRKGLGVVIQEIHLFRASVRDNIAYGLTAVSLEEIIAAAKAANAHDFIVAHPEGYDHLLTDNGSELSGGQRQRIALARTLLRKPSLLILDEATSALDPLAETVVKEALEALPKGSTVIVIAHRRTTLSVADQIVVLDAGRVVQTGSWEELEKADGLFKRMFET